MHEIERLLVEAQGTAKRINSYLESNIVNMTYEDMERFYIASLLIHTNRNVAKASRLAGIKDSTFRSRMRALKINKHEEP